LGTPPRPILPRAADTGDTDARADVTTRLSGTGFLTALHDEEVAAFDLCHYALEDAVDRGVETRVSDQVMRDVYG